MAFIQILSLQQERIGILGTTYNQQPATRMEVVPFAQIYAIGWQGHCSVCATISR